MSMSIRSNISSLDAQRNLSSTQMQLDQSLARLSSGYRISNAADDAAGLAISEKLRSQIRGLNQAARNAQDGISMIQTAEGAMGEVHSMLQRMRELAVQSANDTLTTSDRTAVNTELVQLQAEMNGISGRTTFNGKQLLTGSLVTAQSGGTATVGGQFNTTGGNSSIASIDVSAGKAGDTYTFSGSGTSLTLTRSSDNVSQTIDVSAGVAASGTASLNFAQLGVKIGIGSDAGAKTGAGIVTDFAAATITTAAGSGSANLQVGANASDSISVAFSKIDTSASSLNLDALLTAFTSSLSSTNSAQVSAAQNLLAGVDSAVNTVSSLRANLGAYQNRLDHTIKNINTTSENLSASESRIRDVNVAEESANMTRSNVLMQAGVSVLAQANQLPQLALKLLG
jgi:flagellin